MALRNSLHKFLGHPSHFPTWFFIFGYPIFWLELYVFKARQGIVSPLAWTLFIFVAVVLLWHWLKEPKLWIVNLGKFWSSLDLIEKLLLAVGLILTIGILIIVVLAGFLPIHLIQESDCMQYHYALPRQHLILGSFAHIPWAADDLFLLPIDFALAPFWFVTIFLNKIPQLIICFGLLLILLRLILSMNSSANHWVAIIFIFALLGSHGLSVQMGTGMLDLTIAYLFFAALDSLRRGLWLFAAVEFTFFIWSKPLMPLQIACVGVFLVCILLLARYFKWQIFIDMNIKYWQQSLIAFILLSFFVAGPFIMKSMDYTATPLFPLAPGIMGTVAKIHNNPLAWDSLQQASDFWINRVKNSYGHGRDFIALLKQWWLLAVPEKNVNNTFDYPLGLPYLLFIIPFIVGFVKDFLVKKIYFLNLFSITMWVMWWFSTQQARFLYIPLLIVFMVSITRYVRISKILLFCLIIALSLEIISLWGSHKRDLFRSSQEVLRPEDKQLIKISQSYLNNHLNGYMEYWKHDVAYAQFPVRVTKEQLPHTIKF